MIPGKRMEMPKSENEICAEVINRVIEILERHEREDDYTRFSESVRKDIREIKFIHGCISD